MKKFFKITGILVITLIIVFYLSFLFILPRAVDLNKFKPELQKLVKEQTNLILDFDNPQITVTPLLSAGVKADNLSIKLPDESDFVSADSFTGRIALPSLLFLTVKVSTAVIDNPVINIDVIDNKAFKAVKAYEEILDLKEENIEQTIQSEQKPVIDPALIKILVPKVQINNYIVNVNDLKTGDFLKLRGDELLLGYKNGKTASVKTIAELYLNDKKNITANIDIDTIIPQATKLDEEDDKAQRVEIPFVNPVAMYKAYDLKTNIDSKIKIREKDNLIVANGYLNIDNFTLNLAGMQLPESKFHLKSRGTKADLDTDLYITKEEKITLLGMLNYDKKPSMDMKINTNDIHLDNVINLVKATLDSLHIKHELDPIKGEGFFTADTYIKTDFKKLKSDGNIIISDCIVKNTKTNTELAKVNSVISLDNSILKFMDTVVIVADTLFKIDGTIDEKSNADIYLVMEKMPLQKLFTMFLPAEINNTYTVNSGFINLSADIKGELKKALANLTLTVNNVSLLDKVNKINYLNNILTAEFNSDFKSTTGKITNSDFKLTMNGASVDCDKFVVTIGEKDIVIEPSSVKINNSGTISLSGQIKNYLKNPEFNFNADGTVINKDLKQFFGPDLAIFIKEKGSLPLNVNITGDSKKQTLVASIEANKDNYITPVDIKNVENQNTILKTVIDFKGDRLKIKDTGFYIKNTTQDPDDPEKQIISYNEIVSVDGTITKLDTTNPNINLIKVKMPTELKASICAFPQSSLKTKGSMFVFGDLKAPRVRGEFDVWNISIPELMLSADKIAAKFEGKDLDVDMKNINANGSDYNILMNADLTPSKYFTIKNLNLISNLTDADELMKVSDAAMKYMPASSSGSGASSSSQADIPAIIKDGNIDIKHIKTGNINLYDTTGAIALLNNIFYVNNLVTSGFDGKIKGDVSMNLLTSEIKAVLKGNGLDVEKTLLDAAAMKDTLTGTMDFNADLSLRGSTYEEQMKTLKGKVNFTMKDGSLGPFGKLENLIMAENIRENAFFQSSIGAVLNSLLSFDTAHYNSLKGVLSFNNGVVDINPITSSGNIMGTYIFGDFNLLSNVVDVKLRGRLGSQVSDSMGPLAMLNPVNLVKATPGMSLVLGKLFFLFTEVVTDSEMAQIPSLGKDISDTNSTKFQVVIRGDAAKPLTLVKSFKWLALQSDMDKAQEYLNTIPADTLPIDITTLDKEQIKTQVTEQAKKTIEEAASGIVTEETKQTIKEGKEAAEQVKTLLNDKEETKKVIKETAKNKLKGFLTDLAAPVSETTEETTVTPSEE